MSADAAVFDAFAAHLADPATHGGEVPRRIDTHTAAIFLVGERAYKLRRPVDYGWLDYSSRARRLAAARREARQNEATAPGLGLGLAGLVAEGTTLRLTEPGDLPEGAEPVSVMRRFPDEALFARMAEAGRLDQALMHRTGRAIAAMHRGAALRPGTGDLPGMSQGDDRQLAALAALLGPGVRRLLDALGQAHRRLRPAIERRRARRCHGDLHLGNVILWRDEPAPFDAIDFNDAFSDIDPLFDLAFLLMDLEHRGHAELVPAVLNAWAEAMAAAPGADPETAYAGIALLPLYKAVRAAIRAKVGALAVQADTDAGAAPGPAGEDHGAGTPAVPPPETGGARDVRARSPLVGEGRGGGQPREPSARPDSAAVAPPASDPAADPRLGEPRAYLALALRCLDRPPAARLVAIGGLSGTGKSTVARALAARLGAVVLRSDGIRKGLHGVPETERLPAAAYTLAAAERVYAEILRSAALVLAAPHPVIVDAAHLRPQERGAVEALARRSGCPFAGLWLEAPAAVLRARVAAREGDVSDADAAVVTAQLGRDPGPIAWPRIAAEGTPEDTAALAITALGL
jgi:aminoglycoside phosphotransferase family enzyme/predicted kinase